MTVIKEVEAEVAVKSSPDKFYGIWKNKPYEIAKAASDKILSIELLEGEWGKLGSVLFTTYIIDGTTRTCKERVEVIDDENYSITFEKIGGDVMEYLKSFKATLKCIPKGDDEEGSVVQWIREYEKLNDGLPLSNSNEQDGYAVDLMKKIDAHLLKAIN